ncbi:MAG TPA: hypothetical protein VI454_06490 [Verrucomicrobiae bacterium]|jgi:YVTN family beta-propeller protein
MRLVFRPAIFLAATFALPAVALAQTNFINFEGKQTRPVCLSPDGTRLFAVNTPDARLSVFDVSNPSNPVLISEIPVGIEPGSVNALNNDEVWVVNEVSDSISIVSVSRGLVTDTLQVKDEPADVVFAGGKAFVSAARKNQIAVFDATTHALLTNIAVFGENPRALAVGPAGTNVYAAFALSGNRTTLIPASNPNVPDQPPVTNTNLPPPPNKVGLIVDATDPNWAADIPYTMPDNDVVEIGVNSLAVTRYYSRVGTVNLGLAVRPGTGDLFVANSDAMNLTKFEPVVRGRFYTNRLTRIAVATGTMTYTNLEPVISTNLPNLTAKSNALAQPTSIVFDPSGSHLWLAAFGTDRIAKVDPNGTVLARIEVGSPAAAGAGADPRNKRGPRGLALHAAANRLYVLNRLANSLTVVDTTANSVVRELPVGSFDPTPAVIRQGRGFLYDAKLSGAGVVSCASCHIDSEMDMIAWNLGNPGGNIDNMVAKISGTQITTNFPFHPMKGPMVTQTLRGLNGVDPLHWRGDRTNFLQFNGAFDGLLGGTTLPAADMQAYRDFINTVKFQPNPSQNLDRSLPTNFAGGNPVQGRFTFTNEFYQPALLLSCNTCHLVPNGTDRGITPAAALQESQSFKVPHLRNIYQKLNFNRTPGAQTVGGFGFIHDGTFSTIFEFLSQPVFANFANDTIRKQNLAAFVQCFDTGTAPAVGYTLTLTSNNVSLATNVADWTTLEGQAAVSNIDLIVKGSVNGRLTGLFYQPVATNYLSDKTGLGPFTRAQLQSLILAGDTLSIMGVPPGTGRRMGIDRDSNGTLDGDEPPPRLQITQAAPDALLSWTTNDYGFVLEVTDSLTPPLWSTVTSERGVVSSNVVVTNSLANSFRYFRLRRPW